MSITVTDLRPFETRDDTGVPEWRRVYSLLAGAAIGDVVTYAEMSAALGRVFESNRGPYYRALRQLIEDHGRCAEVVPGVGYTVVPAREHARLVKTAHRSARRKLGRGLHLATRSDRSGLTPEERARIDGLQEAMARQVDATRSLERRTSKVEAAVASITETQTAAASETDARIARLEAALVQHGLA